MRELSVAEQRYQAVLAVISDGETVTDVAARFGVTRKTIHAWLAKYEAGANRIPASRLVLLAEALGLPVGALLPSRESASAATQGQSRDHIDT